MHAEAHENLSLYISRRLTSRAAIPLEFEYVTQLPIPHFAGPVGAPCSFIVDVNDYEDQDTEAAIKASAAAEEMWLAGPLPRSTCSWS